MRITRLHIILIVIVACILAGWWKLRSVSKPKPSEPPEAVTPIPEVSMPAISTPSVTAIPEVKPAASETPLIDVPEASSPDVYVTREGDTLWQIAIDHSPVHQGPAWVVIWRANESAIEDFDHVPAGTTLHIPQNTSDYKTRYWKPRRR